MVPTWNILIYLIMIVGDTDLRSLLDAGKRLPRPSCPDEIHNIMHQCWQRAPEIRPRMSTLSKLMVNPELRALGPIYTYDEIIAFCNFNNKM